MLFRSSRSLSPLKPGLAPSLLLKLLLSHVLADPAPQANLLKSRTLQELRCMLEAVLRRAIFMIGKILAVGFVCVGAAVAQTATAPAGPRFAFG